MWLVGVRDLQYRRRRFLIAVLATSVVFAMTVLMSGMSNGLDAEVDRIVASFHADSWVVARGASGPFTASKFLAATTSNGSVRRRVCERRHRCSSPAPPSAVTR